MIRTDAANRTRSYHRELTGAPVDSKALWLLKRQTDDGRVQYSIRLSPGAGHGPYFFGPFTTKRQATKFYQQAQRYMFREIERLMCNLNPEGASPSRAGSTS